MKNKKISLIITLLVVLTMIFVTACIPNVPPPNGNGNGTVEVCTGCDDLDCEDCDNRPDPVILRGIYFTPNWPAGRPVDHPLQQFAPIRLEVGSTIEIPEMLYPIPNYRFLGWFEGTAAHVPVFNLTAMPNRDISLTARWARTIYINFETGDRGSAHDRFYLDAGIFVAAAELPTPTRPHNLFAYWRVGLVPFTGGIISNTTTLTAHWTPAVSAVFHTGPYGSYVPMITHATHGGSIACQPNQRTVPTREGYSFGRWTHIGEPIDLTTMPAGGLELHATWIPVTTLPRVLIDTFTNSPTVRNPNGPAYRRSSDGAILSAAGMQGGVMTAGANTVGRGVTVPFENIQNPNFNFSDSSWVRSQFRIENAGEFDAAPMEVELRGRGSGSWVTYKRGMRLRFDRASGSTQSFFGMPSNVNFVLVSGSNFSDTTLLANHTAYRLGRAVLTNIPYSARSQMVELYVNGIYHGVYTFIEHIRPVPGRVPIYGENAPSLDRNFDAVDPNSSFYLEFCARTNIQPGLGHTGVSRPAENCPFRYLLGGPPFLGHDGNRITDPNSWLTGPGLAGLSPAPNPILSGQTTPNRPFTIIRPDPDNVRPDRISQDNWNSQRNYIRGHIQALSNAIFTNSPSLAALDAIACVDSMIDMHILHELFVNYDVGWSSFFLFRTPGPNGRIYFSPPWDFDATLGNRGGAPSGIFLRPGAAGHVNNMFYVLTYREEYMNRLRYRWNNIYQDIADFLAEHYAYYMDNHSLAFGKDLYRMRTRIAGGPVGTRGMATATSPQAGATAWANVIVPTGGGNGNGLTFLERRIEWLTNNNASPWRASLIPDNWTPPASSQINPPGNYVIDSETRLIMEDIARLEYRLANYDLTPMQRAIVEAQLQHLRDMLEARYGLTTDN